MTVTYQFITGEFLMGTSISEKVWQGDSDGFHAQLRDAKHLEQHERRLEADCLRASAYYSHFSSQILRNPVSAYREFKLARRFALRAAQNIQSMSKTMIRDHDAATYGQCDVVGTILLREWLGVKRDVELSKWMFKCGIDRLYRIPYHDCALLLIGLAECAYHLGHTDECIREMRQALGFEKFLSATSDQIQAHRQFCRVLRRAFTLLYRLGRPTEAEALKAHALDVASDPRWSSKDQIAKIHREWKMLHSPGWIQALLPN